MRTKPDNSSNVVLLASSRGAQLQKKIAASAPPPPWQIDLLPDPSQLLQQLSQKPYLLLVIDLAWVLELSPAGSFFAKMRAISPHTATLLLAPNRERRRTIEQLQRGAADYILSPIDATELLLKIERILEVQALKSRGSRPAQFDSAPDELLTLHEASQEISRTLQLDEVLKIVLSKVSQIASVHLAKIYLTDRSGNLNKNDLAVPMPPPTGQAREENLLFSLAEQVAFSLKVACFQKTSRPEWQDQPIQSALVIPMISGEKLVGVLALGSQDLSTFSSNQIRWLSIFCDHAAIAIENAGLFQDLSAAYISLAKNREKIIDSRNTLRALFDSITDGLYLLDQKLTINTVNQVEAERQGYQPAELVGKSCLALSWAKAAPELLNQIKKSFETGRKTTWISPENETEPYLKDREFRIYPIRNRLAQIEEVIVFAQDVSERRRWQVSLFRSANLAAVGQLAGSVAHQINNPLTVTLANSQLLLNEISPDSEAHELAAGIFKAGERIQNIVSNLLEFSNQETYFFTLADLTDTIEGALALVIRPLKKARIEVVKKYEAQVTLSVSVSHLKLVWMNLLLNARDAVIDYADRPQIVIATQLVSKRKVKVAITDNGCGIAEENFEQLFRPFFTTKPIGRALGLGLYSAHTIVERHNGEINVSSQPGIATTFEVILPLDNPRDLYPGSTSGSFLPGP